jgi:hypothetical protein
MREIAKPDLRKLVDAIREEIDLACGDLPGVPREALQKIIVRALERGVTLQREVVLNQEHPTPLLPPQTEPPLDFDPPQDPKLPKGIT